MYQNIAVKIPEVKGKIITKRKGSTSYILYQYGSVYNEERKYAIPQRTIVGKVSPSDTTMIFPNEKFRVYFPDTQLPDELPFAYRSCCLKIGSCVRVGRLGPLTGRA